MSRSNILVYLQTLTLGTIGGLIWFVVGLPLPWMVGPMIACGAVALATSVKLDVPVRLRDVMILVVAVAIGSAFTPDIVARAAAWKIPLAIITVSTVVSCWLGMIYLARFTGADAITTFFAAAPASITQMVGLATSANADLRVVSVNHTIRLSAVVITFPIAIQLAFGAPQQDTVASDASLLAFPGQPRDWVLLLLCLLGAPLARRLRIPSADLLGPMIASGLLHYFQIVYVAPAAIVIAAAQVVIGSFIGSRFAGMSLRQFATLIWIATGLVLLLSVVSVAIALATAVVSDIGLAVLLLAFAPGGTPEMSILATNMGLDPAFVVSMHMFRSLLIFAAAPLMVRLLIGKR